MTDKRISELTALTGANVATGDVLEVSDISDTTMDATGTSKKITADELRKAMAALGVVSADSLWDAKGDLAVATGADAASKLAVGANGQVPVADSSASTGIAWLFIGVGVYGDGSDGTVTFDGSSTILGIAPSSNVYTLTRDVFLVDCTINSGVSINTAGYRFFADTLTNNGTIHCNGTSAGGTDGSQAGSGGGGSGSITNNAPIGGSGASGGTGVGSGGGNAVNLAMGGLGGAGGTGVSAGGAAGTRGTAPQAIHGYRFMPVPMLGMATTNNGTLTKISGGTGGGAGGGDGTNKGGGGGGGGGIVIVCARKILGTGTISANGGNGGTDPSGTLGTGGGGAGGGGAIWVVSSSVSGGAITGQTITANAGSVGSGHGTAGVNGSAGTAGNIFLLKG